MNRILQMKKSTRSSLFTYGLVIGAYLIIQLLRSFREGGVGSVLEGQLVPICAYVTMALALNLVVGISGELSLGHAGFMSIGAFAGCSVAAALQNSVEMEPLRLALAMVLGGVMDNAEVIQRLLNNLRKFYPAVHDKMTREGTAKSRRDLQEMLEKGIADGLFVDTINLDLAISVLYYTASAITVRKDLILPAGMTEREAFVQIISNFFRGISTTKGLLLVDDYLKRYEPAKTVHRMQ